MTREQMIEMRNQRQELEAMKARIAALEAALKAKQRRRTNAPK